MTRMTRVTRTVARMARGLAVFADPVQHVVKGCVSVMSTLNWVKLSMQHVARFQVCSC